MIVTKARNRASSRECPSSSPNTRRCAVEETGRNSVAAWTIPRRTAERRVTGAERSRPPRGGQRGALTRGMLQLGLGPGPGPRLGLGPFRDQVQDQDQVQVQDQVGISSHA